MANIAKNFEKYDLSIKYYSKILLNLKQDSLFYADILYRRGSCYERLGNFKKSDIDFLKRVCDARLLGVENDTKKRYANQ